MLLAVSAGLLSAAQATPPSKFSFVLYADNTLPAGMKFTPKSSTFEISKITVKPGGTAGWHSHGGPVLLQITRGTLTAYTVIGGRCVRSQLKKGQASVEKAERVHMVNNEGKQDLVFVAIVNHSKGAPTIDDEAAPANCP